MSKRLLLRRFEKAYAYNAKTDYIYELDEEALSFLTSLDGREVEIEEELYEYLKEEGFFGNSLPDFKEQKEFPSLRYLLVHVTYNCNLKCEHCYVERKNVFMSREVFEALARNFYEMGGLKLIVTGGEPLTHPEIFDFLREARRYPYRIVLLTNGLLIDERIARKLSKFVDEVQISLDGLEGHKMLRGVDYRVVVEKIKLLKEFVDVSVATMITKYNLEEFEKMKTLMESLDVKSWNIDFPSCSEEVVPDFDKASLISLGFGEAHEAEEGYSCGTHLASVTPKGEVTKCGFFEDAVGDVFNLEEAWSELRKKYIWRLSELKCECDFVEKCRGGCRYRALHYSGDIFGEDPVMCAIFKAR
ncbi:Radical SAM domain protein [Ferroglobus placidus DSM 10642]|uniref:Radical SAM domain protein n=1 Tax=Ferroglobus placidus (strain DSM 10642 / AEDII12DO) TaxID=589924 RepID=D3RZ58_FERPA|nr:Radical SAM domain protein [Ferroglobus placidus DSM 10642]